VFHCRLPRMPDHCSVDMDPSIKILYIFLHILQVHNERNSNMCLLSRLLSCNPLPIMEELRRNSIHVYHYRIKFSEIKCMQSVEKLSEKQIITCYLKAKSKWKQKMKLTYIQIIWSIYTILKGGLFNAQHPPRSNYKAIKYTCTLSWFFSILICVITK
jgi:hypothetical protein